MRDKRTIKARSISIRINNIDGKAIDEYSRKTGKTQSEILRMALDEYLFGKDVRE